MRFIVFYNLNDLIYSSSMFYHLNLKYVYNITNEKEPEKLSSPKILCLASLLIEKILAIRRIITNSAHLKERPVFSSPSAVEMGGLHPSVFFIELISSWSEPIIFSSISSRLRSLRGILRKVSGR